MRRWSSKIATISGIGIYVHVTFLLVVGWVAVANGIFSGDITGALGAVGFLLALFGCVLLHELGHALAARRYGIRTRDIILLPIGGVARLERMPERPGQEIVVALAGPAVNVVIALFLGAWLLATSAIGALQAVGVATAPFVVRLLAVNVFLVGFNLLPAFPMDGGRVLRALLALRWERVRATNAAARVGQGMAVMFAVAGLVWNPWLLLIAAFVWFGAGQEAQATAMRSGLSGLRVGQAMTTRFETLASTETIESAIRRSRRGFQREFPVLDDGRLVGSVSEPDLIAAGRERSTLEPIASIVKPLDVVVGTDDSLVDVLPLLAASPSPFAAVADASGRIRGLLMPERVLALSMLPPGPDGHDRPPEVRILRQAG